VTLGVARESSSRKGAKHAKGGPILWDTEIRRVSRKGAKDAKKNADLFKKAERGKESEDILPLGELGGLARPGFFRRAEGGMEWMGRGVWS
jgi:hypothetical protein